MFSFPRSLSFYDVISEQATNLRQRTISALLDEDIYTTDYVNANPPLESEEADAEEEEVQPIPVSETLPFDDVQQQLMDDIRMMNVFGGEVERDTEVRRGLYLSNGLLNAMLRLYRNENISSSPTSMDGSWTQDELNGFISFYNSKIYGHLFGVGRRNFANLIERLKEGETTGEREHIKKVVAKYYKDSLLRLTASGGPAIANGLIDDVRNPGLEATWATAMALVNYKWDGAAESSDATIRELKTLVQEGRHGQDIQGVSLEDYENLNQFGKDMLDETEDHSGNTMAEISNYIFTRGPIQVLTDAGNLVMPSQYSPEPGLDIKVPQTQQGKPLKRGAELPRGLIDEAIQNARSSTNMREEGKTENFTEWIQRESETFEKNFNRASRIAARSLAKTGSPLSVKLTNFATGEGKNAVGSISKDSEWLRKNLPTLQTKATEWKTFWGRTTPLYNHLHDAINRVVASWRDDRPDDFNKWQTGWTFAYNIIDKVYRNIDIAAAGASTLSAYASDDNVTVATDVYGGIAAVATWRDRGTHMYVDSAGTHPLYMPDYPYEQIEKRLSDEAASTNDSRINRALRSFRSMRPIRGGQRGSRGINLSTKPGGHVFAQLARTFLENPDFKHMSTTSLSPSVSFEYKKAGMMHPRLGMAVTRLHMIRYMLKYMGAYVPLEQVTSASGETEWSPIKKQVDYLLMDMDDAIDDMENDGIDEMMGFTPTSFGPFIPDEEEIIKKDKKNK